MVPINKAPLKYVLYLVSVRWDVQHIDQGGHLFTVAKRRGTDIYWLFFAQDNWSQTLSVLSRYLKTLCMSLQKVVLQFNHTSANG